MKKILEGMGLLFKILDKKKTQKRLKELKEKKAKRQAAQHKKNLEMEVSREPMLTQVGAKAADKAHKTTEQVRNEYIERGKKEIRKRYHEAVALFRKEFPQDITAKGGPNPYGHGKGLGAKIERITGTTKESVQKNRQIKRENKQVAKQRRQAGAPERREVQRPKSGLYEDTPKNKKPPWL